MGKEPKEPKNDGKRITLNLVLLVTLAVLVLLQIFNSVSAELIEAGAIIDTGVSLVWRI